MSFCNNETILIHYAIKESKEDDINKINSFKNQGIDILDLNDPFFNDICLPYSDSGTDLTLNNRIEEIYKNYTFCEKNCEIYKINYENMSVSCNCTIKDVLNVKDLNFDLVNYKIEKKNFNFKIIKCINKLSSLKDNLFNLGFWIYLCLLIMTIILLIIFCCTGIKPIEAYLNRIMAHYGYIEKNDEGHAFCHNYIKKLNKLIDKFNQMKNNIIDEREENNPPKRKNLILNDNIDSSKKTFKKENDINKKKLAIENLKIKMEKTKKKLPRRKNFSNKSTNREVFVYETDKNKTTGLKSDLNLKANINIQNKKNIDSFQLNLININLKDLKNNSFVPNDSKNILNIYEFEEAKKYEKRGILSIYHIFLISKQIIMHTIFYKSPIEPLCLRLSLLISIFQFDLALNAYFYTDDKVYERHRTKKNILIFAFTNNLLVIILSTLIGYAILTFFNNLNNIINDIRKIFRAEEEKIKKNKKYVVTFKRKKEILLEIKNIMKKFKIKVIIFYIIEILILIFNWYYATLFCFVYNKTQFSWLFDSFITIFFRIIIDLSLNFIFALFYKLSISSNNSCIYRAIIFFYCFA